MFVTGSHSNRSQAKPLTVSRIAHCGLVITTPCTQILVDPLLKQTGHEAFALDPAPIVNFRLFKKQRWDAVILSHRHADHFSLATLAKFARSTRMIVPALDPGMTRLLKKMGFTRVEELEIYGTLQFDDLKITATPSADGKPEIGLFFNSSDKNGASFWHTVDCVLTKSLITTVIQKLGQPAWVSLAYRSFNLSRIYDCTETRDFDRGIYRHFLSMAKELRRSKIIALEQGWRVIAEAKINRRVRGVQSGTFITDLQKIGLTAVALAAGESLDCSGPRPQTQRQYLKFVKSYERAPRLKAAVPNERLSARALDKCKKFIDGEVRPLHSSQAQSKKTWTLHLRSKNKTVASWTFPYRQDLTTQVDIHVLADVLEGRRGCDCLSIGGGVKSKAKGKRVAADPLLRQVANNRGHLHLEKQAQRLARKF